MHRIINEERGRLVAHPARFNLESSGDVGHAAGAWAMTNHSGRSLPGHNIMDKMPRFLIFGGRVVSHDEVNVKLDPFRAHAFKAT